MSSFRERSGAASTGSKGGNMRLSSSAQDRRPSLRKNGFDEENPFTGDDASGSSADLDGKANNDKNIKSSSEGDGGPPQFELPKYTRYDWFLLTIGVAAPILVLVFGELNRWQAWVFMNRWLVRDIDNQWYYNVWALQNQSNATLYSVTGRMQALAGVYPAVTSTSDSVTAPFVTLSQFEAYGQDIRADDQVLFVSYSPYIVNDENRTSWEEYSVANQRWIRQSFQYTDETYEPGRILEYIWYYNDKGSAARAPLDAAPYAPSWQSSPPPSDPQNIVNQDFTQSAVLAPLTVYINQASAPILSAPATVDSVYGPNVVEVPSDEVGTTSILMLPVYEGLDPDPSKNEIVGFLSGVVPWSTFFENILPSYIVGIQVVVESCNEVNSTFQVNGPDVVFVGPGDLHDPQYDNWVVVSSFADFGSQAAEGLDNACPHTLYFFRTDDYYPVFLAAVPETTVLVWTIVCSFIVIALGYAAYDYFLRLRFKNRVRIANENYFTDNNGDGTPAIGSLQFRSKSNANKLSRGGFDGLSNSGRSSGGLFKETTVLFADVVGLEEWSASRDPSEVFTLLETLYGAFDAIAERSTDVYKVDTFGDNYVAVCGAPVQNRDHPSIMCLFARDCMEESKAIFRSLARKLGKDTMDLSLRFGLASGPVMASIVPGDNRKIGPRLQLSGDTVSTANYIKNTGSKGMIHLTEETASFLIASGRRSLVNERKDRKRGAIRTYWLNVLEAGRNSDRASSRTGRTLDVDDSTTETIEVVDTSRQTSLLGSPRNSRDIRRNQDRVREPSLSRTLALRASNSNDQTFDLVQYNGEILVELLKQVVGRRQASSRPRVNSLVPLDSAARNIGNGVIVIEEAVDVISFPEADPRSARDSGWALRKAQLSPEVVEQVYSFVAVIAGLYRRNAFHNLEHASQTTAILTKMLSKVEATRADDTSLEDSDRGPSIKNYDYAYAIAADPLIKFAMTLAALVHDLDHRGVDNATLMREEPTLTAAYQGRSVHEQNALELAWNVLLSDDFSELRACIYTDMAELKLFRQVMVNCVIATDVFDPALRALRRDRYKRAFSGSMDSVNGINRKATVAVEHLVQAADIGATLQSWALYTKWNEKLYEEAWDAYSSGRTSLNPSVTWYQDEIDFFDKYSIPIAKKLNDCGVFGVAGDEYLNFAEENRRRWVARGREIVAVYVETYGRT